MCMYGHMCQCVRICVYIAIYSIFAYRCHTISYIFTCAYIYVSRPHASLDLLSIETPDSGDSWATWRSLMWSATSFSCKQGKYGIASTQSNSKKAYWSNVIVKPSLLPGTKVSCVCMHLVMPGAGVLQFRIATYKLNMLQQKDRKCWPHRKHGPQAFVIKPTTVITFPQCQKAI